MADAASDNALLSTDLPLPVRRGKVRDVYDLGPAHEALLIVATDRISAFDCVMPNGVPGKGVLLTQMSNRWFGLMGRLVPDLPNHLIETDVDRFPDELRPFRDMLAGRSVIARKADVVPIECVARGYLAGSGTKEYQATGRVCGVELPAGLRDGDRLPGPIFTPATKADEGHDENVSFNRAAELVGGETMTRLRDWTLKLYTLAAEHAAARGILLADTKLEFGRLPDGSIVLIDEIFTPDSSRFWPADEWQPGRDGGQPSYDKQYVREHLERSGWDKTPPAPPLPRDVVDGTRRRYAEALSRLFDAN